jgi:alkanesulfonate monooxygenase SsuD/methylene tetrahydromethanopterin reductase-like flavin-dependent oxidoreductase (luciferase family)
MQFSMWPSPTNPWPEVLATVQLADSGGWHSVWFADHYMPNTGTVDVIDGDMLEAWAVLAALAAATERVRIGPLVAPTTVHHPALLAKRAAAIDRISGGRFVLGLGAGWQINEHGAYGIELFEPRRRVDRFEEAIQIVRSLLAGGRTTFDGTHFQIRDAPCQPPPLQSPLPLLVGSGSSRMMRIIARHADEWNTWGDPSLAGQRARAFDAACERVGRDPATVHRSVQALVHFTDDPGTAATRRSGDMAGRVIAGSTAEVLDTIGRYGDLGFDEFILQDSTLGRTIGERLDGYARFWSEVAAPLWRPPRGET